VRDAAIRSKLTGRSRGSRASAEHLSVCAVVAGFLLTGAGCGSSAQSDRGREGTPTVPLSATAPEGACLGRGAYRTTLFRPRFSFRLGDDNWCYEQVVGWFAPFWWKEKPEFVVFSRPSKVYDPTTGRIVAPPRDFVSWLRRHPGVIFSRSATTTIGRVRAVVLEGGAKGNKSACLWPSNYPGKDQCIGAFEGERLRVTVLKVRQKPLLITTEARLDRWDDFRPNADAFIRTLKFEQ
jgi:hypothetical protein